MKEYLYAWICVAVLAALAEWILPPGAQAKTTGYVRFIIGLTLIVALLPVAREGLEHVENWRDGGSGGDLWEEPVADPYFHEYLSELTANTCKDWVLETLMSRFGVSASQCEVAVAVSVGEDDVPKITEVQICLYGKEIFKNPHEIGAYVEGKLSVPCVVSVGMRKA